MLGRIVFGVVCFFLSACTTLATLTESPETLPEEKVAAAPPLEPLLKKRVLVLPFLNRSNYQEESFVRVALFDIEQAVANAPDLILIKENQVEEPESLYSDGGEYHFKKIFEQAKRAGASGVLLGKIEDVTLSEDTENTGVLGAKQRSAYARVRLQLFDVANEREVYTRTASAEVQQERVPWLDFKIQSSESEEGKEAVSRAVKKILGALPFISKKLAWMGRIARIDLNRYYITGGEQTGLAAGQLLRVYEPPSSISDPLTGQSLGFAPGRFKGLLRVTQLFGPDASVAVLYTGAGFRADDRVEMQYPETPSP
jgi:hypothetical protein